MYISGRGIRTGATKLMRKALLERKQDIENGLDVEPTTQNSFYYYLRTIFLANGIDPAQRGKHFRHNITSKIDDICRELGTTREDLKIIADARATFYYNNQKHYISLENVEKGELYVYGTDIVIIEKSSLCDLLAPSAAESGIALIDTGGYTVDYAKLLASYAEQTGCNVSILSDFDADGILMSYDVWKNVSNNIYKIGIDFDSIDELKEMYPELADDLTEDNLQKRYTPDNSMVRLRELKQSLEDYLFGVSQGKEYSWNLDYLSEYRIEIDSVQRVLGYKKFWAFLLKKLEQRFPTRNYNRVIRGKDLFMLPSIFLQLRDLILDRMKPKYNDLIMEKKLNFEKYEGIITDVNDDKRNLELYFKGETYKYISDICNKIEELINEYQGNYKIQEFMKRVF